jgi:hypothetical protein
MALYLISYDVAEGNVEDYRPLWDLMEELGATRILYSQWVVQRHNDAMALYNEVKRVLRKGDGLLVNEVTRTANWEGLRVLDNTFRKLLEDARI